MSIIFDDVSCLLHLSVSERLLDHSTIHISKTFYLMVTKLVFDVSDALKDIEDTREYHARCSFLTKKNIDYLNAAVDI